QMKKFTRLSRHLLSSLGLCNWFGYVEKTSASSQCRLCESEISDRIVSTQLSLLVLMTAHPLPPADDNLSCEVVFRHGTLRLSGNINSAFLNLLIQAVKR
ncbi:MAG: hypothetical protein ACRC0C_08890, partial [Gibbsiella quercinecans]